MNELMEKEIKEEDLTKDVIAKVNTPQSPRDKELQKLSKKTAKWGKFTKIWAKLSTAGAIAVGYVLGKAEYAKVHTAAVMEHADEYVAKYQELASSTDETNHMANIYQLAVVSFRKYWLGEDSDLSNSIDWNSPTIIQDLRDIREEIMSRYSNDIHSVTVDERSFVRGFDSKNGAGLYDEVEQLVDNAILPPDVAVSGYGIGVVGGLVSFTLVAGFPIARYAVLKHKLNKLNKELGINPSNESEEEKLANNEEKNTTKKEEELTL